MNFWIYLLAATISYLGMLAGIMLIFIAPEELAPGRKYFRQLFYILFSLCIFMTLYSINLWAAIITSIVVFIAMSYAYSKIPLARVLVYPLLGVFIGLSSGSQQSLLVMSALVFITGFPFGSLTIKEYRKKDRAMLIRRPMIFNLTYFLLVVVLFFV